MALGKKRYRGLVAGKRAEKPISGRPAPRLECVQHGSKQGAETHDDCERGREAAVFHSAAKTGNDPLIDEEEAEYVNDDERSMESSRPNCRAGYQERLGSSD